MHDDVYIMTILYNLSFNVHLNLQTEYRFAVFATNLNFN